MMMLIYRLVHSKEVMHDIDIDIKRRNKELCNPYIQLFYGSAVQQEIEQTLQRFLDIENNRKSTSQESILLPIVIDLITSSESVTISVSAIWDKITTTLEGQIDDSGAFHTSDW